MKTDAPSLAIAYRQWMNKTFYVANLPGEGGVDWGWDDRASHARKLSPYWQRRFAADMRYIGDPYRIIPV